MPSKLLLSESQIKIAVNMVPLRERRRTPVKEYTATIKLKDDTGTERGKLNRIYITEGSKVNQAYDFIVDFNKIDLGDLSKVSPIVVAPGLFNNEEELALCINNAWGVNVGKLDIIYDPIPNDAGEVLVEIDNRSRLYRGSFIVLIQDQSTSIFAGVDTVALEGFDEDQLILN